MQHKKAALVCFAIAELLPKRSFQSSPTRRKSKIDSISSLMKKFTPNYPEFTTIKTIINGRLGSSPERAVKKFP
jgi:hypothetical protein